MRNFNPKTILLQGGVKEKKDRLQTMTLDEWYGEFITSLKTEIKIQTDMLNLLYKNRKEDKELIKKGHKEKEVFRRRLETWKLENLTLKRE